MRNSEALKKAAGDLTTAGVASPRLDAEILLAHILGLERTDLLGRWGDVLNPRQIDKFESLIARRKKREPVARITGIQEFWSLPFLVAKETLVPRPDSEVLVAAVLKNISRKKDLRILDLGAGTGCLLLSLLSELPDVTGVGVDFSKEALDCARENAKNLNLAGRARFTVYDWMNDIPLNEGSFDIVISNPPYIPTSDIAGLEPEVARFAPRPALDGGANGLVHYEYILKRVPEFLSEKKSGMLFFEIGEGQAEDVARLLEGSGFRDIQTRDDLARKARVISARTPAAGASGA